MTISLLHALLTEHALNSRAREEAAQRIYARWIDRRPEYAKTYQRLAEAHAAAARIYEGCAEQEERT